MTVFRCLVSALLLAAAVGCASTSKVMLGPARAPIAAEAVRVYVEPPANLEVRIVWAWQQALQRNPTATEMRALRELLDRHLKGYRADPKAAGELLKTGQAPVPDGLDPAELAAWSHVARVLLNLHETITRS